MSKRTEPPEPEAGELGVTIKSTTNAILDEIKRKTGLSKSQIANIGLAHVAQQIADGKLRIVNQTIELAEV